LFAAALDDGQRLIAATRKSRGVLQRAATVFQNRILGLRLRDYASAFRVYSADSLRLIPFQLNSNDHAFDMELLIQYRALGAEIREVLVAPTWSEHADDADAAKRFLRRCGTAVGYRLHQLHATRRGRYFVDEGIHYTLKLSRTGSHIQIVEALAPETFVLDLGCSQGLLARPLQARGVRVVGVDTGPGERLAAELEQYFQRDLEEPLELPFGRVFDAVVVSDVIEHVRERPVLLRSVRRYLKEGGRLIISTPNIALWFYRLSLLVGRFEYGPRGVLDETHVHLFTRSTFRREVERAGFRIVGERVTALPFEVVLRSTGRSRLVRALAGVYHGLARAWPGLFAYQFILEAEIATLDDDATLR
ncbi:MAG: methyltransferase domain-containing protein, partial [Myxococcota bacterium]